MGGRWRQWSRVEARRWRYQYVCICCVALCNWNVNLVTNLNLRLRKCLILKVKYACLVFV